MGESDLDHAQKPITGPQGQTFEDFDACVAAMSDEEGIDDPEAFCAWLEEEGKEALSDPNAEEVLAGLEVEFVSAVDEPAQDSEWVIAKNAEDPEGDTHRWQTEVPLLVRKASWEVHTPTYDEVAEPPEGGDWDGIDFEEVASTLDWDVESYDSASDDQREFFNSLFIASASGFPADDVGDLHFEVVDVREDGTREVRLQALKDARDAITQFEGPDDVARDIENTILSVAQDAYPESELADESNEAEASAKSPDVKQVAFAPVLIPKEADKQGDVIPAPAIEDAAHKYLAEYRKVDSDHDLRDGKGTPVESWTLKQDTSFERPDGSESRTYPEGTWVMGIKFDDETWERVKAGELTGLSIYGGAKPVEVDALLGKGTDTDADADGSTAAATAKNHDEESTMGTEPDDPGDSGNDGVESTQKQEITADQVSAMLAEFGSMVEDGSVSADATVKEFVQTLIQNGAVDEGEVRNLSVLLTSGGSTGGGDDGQSTDEGEQAESDDGGEDEGMGLDAKSDDGDGVDKGDDGTEDVDKSVDDDGGDTFDDAPEWAKALKSEVDDLREKVEDPPRADKMESADELSDRIAKELTGADDPDVARKAIREQVEKSGESGASVDYDGITEGEDADASATPSDDDSSLHSAAANSRMVGGDN